MIIDGKKIAKEIQEDLKTQIDQIEGRKPGLTFILVGEDPASHTYVRMKKKACSRLGIISNVIELSGSISQNDLLSIIEENNQNPEVDGILVQMPLPKQIETEAVTQAIIPEKDVDAFHPINVGKMLIGDDSGFLPCTPNGIKILLEKSNVDVSSKHVVIIGRSNIVGKPLAAILMQKKPGCNASVTVLHSGSKNLESISKTADILIAAIGKPHFVTEKFVKKGAIVVDVGINRIMKNNERILVGDVDFENVSKIASHITPVPGGVGPMTITLLLHNTYSSFLRKNV